MQDEWNPLPPLVEIVRKNIPHLARWSIDIIYILVVIELRAVGSTQPTNIKTSCLHGLTS